MSDFLLELVTLAAIGRRHVRDDGYRLSATFDHDFEILRAVVRAISAEPTTVTTQSPDVATPGDDARMNERVTLDVAAAEVGVSRRTLERRIAADELTVVRDGRRVQVVLGDAVAAAARRRR